MLRRISIRNYLLIDTLDLDLSKGLTAITGETGSGKSILIGALGLAMGDRADMGVARDALQRCVIELEVGAKAEEVADWCERNEVPHEVPMILRRQIDPGNGGRSRAFVNDTPVRLEQLRELGERLVHVHSQHHTLLLNDPAFQLGLVDHFADHNAAVVEHAARYHAWRKQRSELDGLREEEERARSEGDYVRFQLDELQAANLLPDEQAALEQALARADHAEEILRALRAVVEGIDGEDGALADLARSKPLLAKAARSDEGVQRLLDRLQSVSIELKDMADEAEQLGTKATLDPKEAERLRERLDGLIKLQQKHRVRDVDGLIALRTELEQRATHMGNLGERIPALEANERKRFAQLEEGAGHISAERRKALLPLSTRVTGLLHELGMPRARFELVHQAAEMNSAGIDRIKAFFTANDDRQPAPLEKVASGGELSRVMLALISLAAESKGLATVIFDEIDTGVSGEVAHSVGSLMARMARDRQVIAITHLPQIASKAATHLLVSKDHESEHVTTSIHPLDTEQRVHALASMLSGKKASKAAVENARELLKRR